MKNTLRNYLFVLIPIETIVSILMQRTDDEGFVYILSNPAYKNNFVKIGKTSVSPRSRASELSTTGVPTPFSVEYYCKAKDYHRLEKRVHQYLQKERVSPKKEFFEITIDRAIFAIQELGKNDILHEEIAAEKRKEMEELVRQQKILDTRQKEINEFTKNLSRELDKMCNDKLNSIKKRKKPAHWGIWDIILIPIGVSILGLIIIIAFVLNFLIGIIIAFIIWMIWAKDFRDSNNDFKQKIQKIRNEVNRQSNVYCKKLNDILTKMDGNKWDTNKEHYKKKHRDHSLDSFKKLQDRFIKKLDL